MNFTKTMFALAIGSVGIMGAMSATAAALPTGSVLSINNAALDANGYVLATGGSWFGMDANGKGGITAGERTGLSQGTAGLVIGVTTTAGASHGGSVLGTDTATITDPWEFFTNTGSDFNVTPIVAIGGDTVNGLDFGGWRVTWNGIPSINMGGGAWGAGFTNGVANFTWGGANGGAYTLDYHATVPVGDPSGFGGVPYALHLEGNVAVAAVPEASTYGMMLAGLGLVGFAVRRRKSGM